MSIGRRSAILVLPLAVLVAGSRPARADELSDAREKAVLATLAPPNPETSVLQGLVTIEEQFPDSQTAAARVLPLLKDSRAKVRRKAVRVLGVLQPKLEPRELADVTKLLASSDGPEVVDALKGLRGLYAPPSIPAILPLLRHPDEHVKREACRTLAIVADRSVVPSLEPLLKDPVGDVRTDAEGAIAQLRRKP